MLKPGMMLCDRYEILDVVGAGGMSIVYKAKCHRLNRNVAIKVLKPEYSNDKNFVTKFRIEAQASAGLSHPNIVNVYDVYDDEGIYFIVMELVDGITLKEYIAENGRLSMDKAIDFSIQIASGLEAAHESHIIHRDIKPQNIIVAKNGNIKVTDFGIAKAASPNTLTSGAMGSVHYISPEQARGGYSDERSDIYSLGITMYEMVTGRVPFEGENNVSIALMHIQSDMIPPRQYYPDIYSSFEKIIMKATQKKPERRYLTASALIADLKRVQNNPNIDIVVASSAVTNSPTQEWTKEDVQAIREGSALKDAAVSEPQYDPQYIQQPNNQQYDAQYTNPPLQNEMGEIQSNGGILTIPVNNNKIQQLLQEDDSWEDEDDYQPQQQVQPIRKSAVKKVQDYDDDDYGYNNDDDGELDPKLKKGVMIAGVAAAVVIAIVLLIMAGKLLGIFKTGKSGKDNSTGITTAEQQGPVEIPMVDVLGMSKDAAYKTLTDMGFTNVKLQEEENLETQAGYVFFQSVSKDTLVKSDSEIIIKYASEAEDIAVPSVAGYTDEQAQVILTEAGFVVSHSYENSETVEKDYAIKTEPEAGTMAPKGSKVKLVISNGSEIKQVACPDLRNRSEAQAINLLNNAKLTVGNVTHDYDDTIPAGSIISQSIEPNTMVDEGTTVDYVISDGPKPQETTYTAKIAARITAPSDGSFDGQAVTVQVKFNGQVIYEGAINDIMAGNAYDVTTEQPGLSEQSGSGEIVIIDANGNNVTDRFSPSIHTSFEAVTG